MQLLKAKCKMPRRSRKRSSNPTERPAARLSHEKGDLVYGNIDLRKLIKGKGDFRYWPGKIVYVEEDLELKKPYLVRFFGTKKFGFVSGDQLLDFNSSINLNSPSTDDEEYETGLKEFQKALDAESPPQNPDTESPPRRKRRIMKKSKFKALQELTSKLDELCEHESKEDPLTRVSLTKIKEILRKIKNLDFDALSNAPKNACENACVLRPFGQLIVKLQKFPTDTKKDPSPKEKDKVFIELLYEVFLKMKDTAKNKCGDWSPVIWMDAL